MHGGNDGIWTRDLHLDRVTGTAKLPYASMALQEGFEPSFSGPEPDVLPLHHRRKFLAKSGRQDSNLHYVLDPNQAGVQIAQLPVVCYVDIRGLEPRRTD